MLVGILGGKSESREVRKSGRNLIPGPSPEGEGCLFEIGLDLEREFCGELSFSLGFNLYTIS